MEVNNVNYALSTYHNLTAIENTAGENEISLYPNPAGEQLMISGIKPLQEVRIFDLSGKRIYSAFVGFSKEYILNTEGLDAGMYLLQVKSADGSVLRTKFIRSKD